MGRKLKPITTIGNWEDAVKEMPSFDKRYDGDCTIIAAALASGLTYNTAAAALIADGVYDPEVGGGSPEGLCRWVQREVWNSSRVRWQHLGISLQQYMVKRPEWSGVLVHTATDNDPNGCWHAVFVRNGKIYNYLDHNPTRIQVAVTLAHP